MTFTEMDRRCLDVVRSRLSISNDDDRGQTQLEKIHGEPLRSLLTTEVKQKKNMLVAEN